MNNTKKTIAHFGGGYRIQIEGAPANVSRELNRLYNAGVLTSFDASYREGEDSTVTANSYPARFNKGVAALAKIQVAGMAQKHGLRQFGTLRKLIQNESENIRGEFERVENIYVDKHAVFTYGDLPPREAFAKE